MTITTPDRDPGLDALLDLHGQTLFVDGVGHWGEIRRAANRSDSGTAARAQLFADAARAGRRQADRIRQRAPDEGAAGSGDAETRGERPQTSDSDGPPYDYKDAATLLGDFWDEVDRILKEGGVTS